MKTTLLALALVLCGYFSVSAQTEATFYTNQGNFVVELYDSIMPITTDNFKLLTNVEFYDGVIFHRIISAFVIQGGDPTGTGSGGPGYTIMDEFDSTTSNVQYTLSMANTGAPNSGGSQFFINLVNNTFLDFDKAPLSSAHPVFAEVISGFDVVDAIGVVPTDGSDRPLDDVIMDSVRLTNLPTVSGLVEPIDIDAPQISVYPNPIAGQSNVTIAVAAGRMVELAVVDMLGRTHFVAEKQLLPGLNSFQTSDFGVAQAGQYQLVVRYADDRSFSHSFVLLK